MSLQIGIVGLPNVGKSTLFNALTKAGALAANYPFATIEPNTGVVPIPDHRVGILAGLFGSKKVTPATVSFVDIAGLVEGASEGEGLGNRFLANIRNVDAICHVVRAFESADVARLGSLADPASDIAIVETELGLADLQTIEKRLARTAKEATIDKALRPQVELLERLKEHVGSAEKVIDSTELMVQLPRFADLQLLTAKPVIFVFNSDEALLADPERQRPLVEMVAPADALFLDAQIEAELVGLPEEERMELLASIGQEEPGLDAVISAAYRALGLQSFLTAGEKEARAWTIPSGSTALQAAGVIHTDFARGFIAADVIDFDVLVEAGSWVAARGRGLIRTEGKGYQMRPNDVVEFRFNV